MAATIDESAAKLLAVPGGKGTLRRDGDAFVSESGERFEIDGGVVRTLRNVDPDLARELESQIAGMSIYTDESLLMPRYENEVAELATVKMFGGRPPSGTVLDAGCGIGILGRLYPGIGLVGLDASLPLLRNVTSGYRMLVEGSAEALPFADGSFDHVIALNMLHHVINPANAVREFARVLKPGGKLVAVDPRKVWPVELAKQVLRKDDAAFAPTHKAFGVDEYESIIRGSGKFSIEEEHRVGLISLLGMGGLDATGISRRLPAPGLAVSLLTGIDEILFRLPAVPRAGLNLAIRARRV
jgi:SAM-dependent methyltransferase